MDFSQFDDKNDISFAGTDYGFANMAATIPASKEKYYLNITLNNKYDPLSKMYV
jgi:hypothetical protein